jgi:multiple sugar transport system substrate-binding protein
MNPRIRTSALALLAGGALAFTGCSAGGTADDGTTEITFVGADPAEAFEPLIAAFEAQHPDISVEYQNIPFDQYNNVIQQRVGAKDPSIDVLLVDAGASASMASRGWLADLSELRDQADENSIAASVEQSVWDDELWALPFWTSAQYLYYNADLLEAAGVEPPTADGERWTWEQVVDAGKQAQAAGAEYGLLFDQTDRYYQLQPLAESAGGGSGATGPDLLTADITNEGWQRSMDWYASLFADGVAPRGIATDQMNVLFASGKSAFFVGGPWSVDPISKGEPPISYGVAKNPMFEGGTPAMSTGSWSIGVSAATDELEAATAFAEFASLDPEGNAAAVEQIIIPPTNLSAFDAYIERLDQTDEPNTAGMGQLTLSELQDAAVSRPNTVGFTQMQDVMGRAFADIRNGQPVDETLQKAQDELQGLWDRL